MDLMGPLIHILLISIHTDICIFPGWIEPLLDRVADNWSNVIMPLYDYIDPDDLHYTFGEVTYVGVFGWDIYFAWDEIPATDAKRPGAPFTPVR